MRKSCCIGKTDRPSTTDISTSTALILVQTHQPHNATAIALAELEATLRSLCLTGR